MYKITYIILAFTAFLLLNSCKKDDIETPPGYTSPTATGRVLLVYIGADSDLSFEARYKIEKIKSSWNADTTDRLIIYADFIDEQPTLNEVIKSGDQNILKVIKRYPEHNSASGEVLAQVIDDVKKSYRAPSYGLLVFSHGNGWLPPYSYSQVKSIIYDAGKEMSIQEFAAAIPDKMFEFIIFESCYMSGIETSYELRNKTNYILGTSSPIISPGFYNVYPNALHYLFDPEQGLENFARLAYLHINSLYGDRRSIAISVIKTDGLEPLASWVKENADFDKYVNINEIQHFDTNINHLFSDFVDYVERLLDSDEQRSQLNMLVNNCITYKASTESFMPSSETEGFTINKHSGLTIYIPQNTLPELNEEYKKLEWAKAVGQSSDQQE